MNVFLVRDRERARRRQFDRVARDKRALRCACAQNTIKPVTAGFCPLSPRLEQLRSDLVRRIPCETAAARQELQGKHLTDVLIAYLTWQARLIRPRPRDVVIWPR